MGKAYKRKKKGSGRFVQLTEYMQKTEAWDTLAPGPRALYIALKRRYNGANNGQIILSHRDAAKEINVHRNTVGRYFEELQARGFIRMTQPHCLGPSGVGKSSIWALEEYPMQDNKPAGRAFARWSEKQKPRTTERPTCHHDCDTEVSF